MPGLVVGQSSPYEVGGPHLEVVQELRLNLRLDLVTMEYRATERA